MLYLVMLGIHRHIVQNSQDEKILFQKYNYLSIPYHFKINIVHAKLCSSGSTENYTAALKLV